MVDKGRLLRLDAAIGFASGGLAAVASGIGHIVRLPVTLIKGLFAEPQPEAAAAVGTTFAADRPLNITSPAPRRTAGDTAACAASPGF